MKNMNCKDPLHNNLYVHCPSCPSSHTKDECELKCECGCHYSDFAYRGGKDCAMCGDFHEELWLRSEKIELEEQDLDLEDH